jgi:MSHA biogenesis protein MshK
MAEAVNRTHRLLAAAALCGACLCGHAQSLQDPTRPPAITAVGEHGAPLSIAGPQLQSVLISRQPGGRHVAVIDGDTVRLGESFRGARVTRITAGEVELARGKERQVLKLARDAADGQDGSTVTPIARLK